MAQQSVTVSHYFIDSLSTILRPSRLLGLMPYKYQRNDVKSKLRFSKSYATYGVITAIILSLAVSGGISADILNENSIRLSNPLDKYVAVVEIATLIACLWTICVCFIFQKNSVLQMAYHFTQVDNILKIDNASRIKQRSQRFITVNSVSYIILLIYTHYVWIAVTNVKFYAVFYSAGYYISHIVLLGVLSLYWILSDSVSRRIDALQKGLTFDLNRNRKAKRLTSSHVSDMNLVYGNIYAGLTSFSGAYGPIILAIMMNILITLIASLYVILQQAAHHEIIEMRIMEVMWGIFHFGRLIIIVEPAHRLSEGLARVRFLIADLLSYEVNDELKTQIEILTTQILLSPEGSFSPFGMFNVNRGVIMGVVGSVTTYVVLILNFHKD